MAKRINVDDSASIEEAEAIARAMANHAETDVEVYVGDTAEPAAICEPDLSPIEDDLGPTEREELLLEQIEDVEKQRPSKKHGTVL